MAGQRKRSAPRVLRRAQAVLPAVALHQARRPAGLRVGAKAGVTLLEMMVVLGLVALLATILIPIFGGIRARQRRTSCASNLRALAEAILMYRDDYRAFPPDVTESWGGKKALGLYYLNYLSQRPKPAGALYGIAEADYLPNDALLHCPSNPVGQPSYDDLKAGAPTAAFLGGYNADDWFYRRDWDAALKAMGFSGWPTMGKRNLMQPYPPDDTVVTWCTMHRNAQPTSTLQGLTFNPERGDRDLVLFVDGSVETLLAAKDQYQARHP